MISNWWLYCIGFFLNIGMIIRSLLYGTPVELGIYASLTLVNLLGMEVEELKAKSK